MTTAAVRLDRLQVGIIAWVRGALPLATVVWGPSGVPRAAANPLVAVVRTLGGPGAAPLGGVAVTNTTLPLTALLTVVSAPVGEAVGLRASGVAWEYEVQAGDDVTAARDGLLAVLAGPVGEPPLIAATFVASGVDGIAIAGATLGDLYGLAPHESVAGLVTVANVTEAAAQAQTSNVRTYVEIETLAQDTTTHGGAVAALSQLMHTRRLRAARTALGRHGLAITGNVPPPVDLTSLAGPDWQSRASISLYFAQAALAAEPASLITTARGTMDARAAVPDTIVTLTPQISP